jgi:hypothetical protein
MELFAQATRHKLRFTTPIGPLSAEDLWDLPLTSRIPTKPNLDDLAIALDKQLRDAGTTSFVSAATRTNEILKLKFDIVLQVIEVKKAERDAEELKATNSKKKEQILEIMAQKQNEELAGKSIDELRELVNAL